jgi:hypothetical protein
MCPPPRSLALEANGCFMVRVPSGPNRIQGCGATIAPDSELPSDQDHELRCLLAFRGSSRVDGVNLAITQMPDGVLWDWEAKSFPARQPEIGTSDKSSH